ncbi:MAG TPA: cation:proton antiporter [Candidatus Limnocylindrales bacterium]|nr:cation:proton antiporter [Candidatus Limnocylindrales bacterium]
MTTGSWFGSLAGTGPGGVDVAPGATDAPIEVIVGVFVLLLAAKIGEEVFRRLHQPAVVGELLGGFVVGPSALGLVDPGEAILVFAEIGVVILLFQVGLEVRLDDLLRVGRVALVTALAAMLLPIVAGVAVGLAMGEEAGAAAFIGLALAATSIGITSRVLAEAGVLDRRFARIVLAAAVVDDILALIAIGVVTAFATGTEVDRAVVLGISAIGLVLLGLAAARRARGLKREVFTWPLFADTPLVPSFLLMLALALVSAVAGLAALIGAFIAGLIVAETEASDELEHEIRPLGLIFTPFFFAVTGTALDLGALVEPSVLVLAVALVILGVATKAVGGYVGARSTGQWAGIAVGFGMVPRGEVGIVVANLGLAAGLFSTEVFGAVLLAVVATTMAAPYLLAWAVPRAVAEEEAESG